MVAVRCKACQHVSIKKRTPARCENCGAKFAIVGGELVYGKVSEQAPAPQKISAKVEPAPKSGAKKLEITPKTTPEVKKPAPPAPKAKDEPFECSECGAVLTKGQERCVCGVALEWPKGI